MQQKRNPLTWRWNILWKQINAGPLRILIVDELPQTWEEGTIYIVQGAMYSTMYVRDPENSKFIKVWTTKITLQEQSNRTEEDNTEVSYIKNKPILAEVATTGSFYSLEDYPEIPEVFNTIIRFKKNWFLIGTITTNQENESEIDYNIPEKTSELENDSGFISKDVNNLTYYTKTEDLAEVALSNDYNDLDNKPEFPTKLSEFENDMWFIDRTVNNLTNYYQRNKLYTKTEIDNLLAGLSSLRVEVVEELPNPGEFGVIYLIESDTPGTYIQYILTELPNTYAEIGNTAVDLSDYFNKTTDTSDDITQWDTNLFMTEAEKINLSHQSWYNTGDETKITILEKMWPASATNDWYLKKEDWVEFDSKVDYDDFVRVDASSGNIAINNYSTETTAGGTITVSCGSSVKSGLVYLLKVNATSDVTLNLGTGVVNANDTNLTVPAGKTKVFVMLATSSTQLAMQGLDTTNFMTRADVEDMIGDWIITITQWTETVGSFSMNQKENITLDINNDVSPQIFTDIGTASPGNRYEWNHWLPQIPWIVNVDCYAQLPNDEYNRTCCSRAMATWKNLQTDFLGTVLYFSNAGAENWHPTMPGTPMNMTKLPITIQVTNQKIYITADEDTQLVKFRITAFL